MMFGENFMHRLPDQINNSICHIKATIEAQLLQRPVEIFFDSSVIRDLHEAQPFSYIYLDLKVCIQIMQETKKA